MKNFVKEDLPTPLKDATFYEDPRVYACLANFPIVPGHCVVVWKEKIKDIHLLKEDEYEELMEVVEKVRNALMKVLNTDKVYLFYMDEIEHVHWHLIPRNTDEEGFTLLEHAPKELKDVTLANKLRKAI